MKTKNAKPKTLILTFLIMMVLGTGLQAQDTTPDSSYTLIIDGYDWGPGVNKVVLPMGESVSEVNASDFLVEARRSADGVQMSPQEAQGTRKVLHAYVSNQAGKLTKEGNHATLVLLVSPTDPLGSPMKYIFKDGRGSNKWIDYKLDITHKASQKKWNSESARMRPQIDKFDLNGTYGQDGIDLTYASYVPKTGDGKSPLIIWLHGGGEGGTDPSIPLSANKATNYASDEIQTIFGGAYVLVPQSPTFWMQNADGEYTRGDKNDIYNVALMGLIKKYVTDNPEIDQNRIYVGGCSNGGYMSLKLIMEHPDYFAAAYISALAYQDQFVTDAQVESIKNVPIWFLHCKDDQVTKPDETVVPLYKRLIEADAVNVHFSYYDNAYDITGFYGGKDFRYNGHFSWIYSHANHANFDFDGKPVTVEGRPVAIMEWMALQKK